MGRASHEPRPVMITNSRGNTVESAIAAKSTDTFSGFGGVVGRDG